MPLSMQEVWDSSWRSLTSPLAARAYDTGKQTCVYSMDEDTRRCVVGQLLPGDQWDLSFEGSVIELMKCHEEAALDLFGIDVGDWERNVDLSQRPREGGLMLCLLRALQGDVHDSDSSWALDGGGLNDLGRARMVYLALSFGLDASLAADENGEYRFEKHILYRVAEGLSYTRVHMASLGLPWTDPLTVMKDIDGGRGPSRSKVEATGYTAEEVTA